ncbi:hypothetical protein AK88_01024 [Plasmodium fragile]|uniref:Uncharacterized protein n=1 Tax=Plasmodium fragile TaxID=5857 RepID=A0A0D9QQZ5_PLAFR|nr:uncharacterized protein AK88_01024 [Plasmodium fragile]KJP89358.1 hypothetical protein AK88_01024 [Plasmodium fragile]
MGHHRDPIKVKTHNGGRVPSKWNLTKEQRVAHILLKEGINYVENENVKAIKSDEYVRTLLFDYVHHDMWEDEEGRKLKWVRLPRSSNARERSHTHGEESTCFRDGHSSKEEEANNTNMCNLPLYKKNNCNQRGGEINGTVITPLVRTHDKIILKKRFIKKRKIKKIKRLNKKTPYGYYHRGGKPPLKVQKRGKVLPINPRGGVSGEFKRGSGRTLSHDNNADGWLMKSTAHSQWGDYVQVGTITKNLKPSRGRTHFSPFQRGKIGTHKKEPLPIGEMNNELVKIHFNELNSFSLTSEDVRIPLGVDSLLGANKRKSFSCAHTVSTPFYDTSCLSCVGLDQEKKIGGNVVAQGYGRAGGERQTGGFQLRQNKRKDFQGKEKRRKKSSRESQRDRAHHGDDRPPRQKEFLPKDGMCHSVDTLLCRSKNRDLFNERNNEIMVNVQGGENERRRGGLRREDVTAAGGPNMDVCFDSDLRGVQMAIPDLKSHTFQPGTVLSKNNSGGRRHPRGARTEQQVHVGVGANQTDLLKGEGSIPIVDKMKIRLDELTNREKRRDLENAYVKYIYKRDESQEVPEEKRNRYVTFGSEENDALKIGEMSCKKKKTQRTYKDQLRNVINIRNAHVDKNVYGFGETLKFMKYRELLRKYMGTFYNYSSVKCATYIVLYALVVKIMTQVSTNLTTSSGTLPSEKANDTNLVWYNDSNLFLNVHDMDGIIQSICYVSLLVCIILLLKLGIPSNYLLAGRLTILFMFFFFAQIPIMIYANVMFLKKEEGIAKAQAKVFEKKDYFNLHMQRVYDVFYMDTLNLLVYTILLSLVSLYATYHKLIYPHLLKFYLDTFFLSSYTIVKKEVIQFRVPNNIDAYYLNQMNSYMFNSLYKKQEDLTQNDLESNTRSAIGYNIVIKKERCSLFRRFFRRNASDSVRDEGGHGSGTSVRGSGRVRRTCGWRTGTSQQNAPTQWNLNFYIIFYIGELDDHGRPHGFGYWRGINLEGEVLIGYWFHGIPVGPFKCRDFKTGSGFMCIKIGYGRTNCEPNDLDIGLADTECCVSGAFYRTFPRVVFYDLNLTTPNRRSKKKDEDQHGIMEKRECCEYLHISRASNDILRVDYAKLLQDSEDGGEGEADPARIDQQNKIGHHSDLDENSSEGIRSRSRIMGRVKKMERGGSEGRRFMSASSKEDHRKGSNNRSTMTCDEIPPSIINNEPFLKGELLNFDDICNLSYDFNDLTVDNETHSVLNNKMETSDGVEEEQQQCQQQWGEMPTLLDEGDTHVTDVEHLPRAEMGATKLSQWRHHEHRTGRPVKYVNQLSDHTEVHKREKHRRRKKILPSEKMKKGRASKEEDSHISAEEQLSRRWNNHARNDSCPDYELGTGDKVYTRPRRKCQDMRMKHGFARQGGDNDETRDGCDERHDNEYDATHGDDVPTAGGREGEDPRHHSNVASKQRIKRKGLEEHDAAIPCAKPNLELLAGREKTRRGSQKREHKVVRLHMGGVESSEAPPVESGSPDANSEGDESKQNGEINGKINGANNAQNVRRKIKRHIGYSMTNTIQHLRKFKHLKMQIKRKKKKKNTQTRQKEKEKEKNKMKTKFKTNIKKKNLGGRKTFLPRALSGNLPKLKIKKKKKKYSFPTQ